MFLTEQNTKLKKCFIISNPEASVPQRVRLCVVRGDRMRKMFLSILVFMVTLSFSFAGVGIFEHVTTLNGLEYNAGVDLGAFARSGLILDGGEARTFQNDGDDVCLVNMEYTVTDDANNVVVSGSIVLTFDMPLASPGDKLFNESTQNINISDLPDGNYTLTIEYIIEGKFDNAPCLGPDVNEFVTLPLQTEIFDFSIDASLPVQLTHFTAHSKDKQVALNWRTATEQNNDHFELQRSADGRAWSAIGKIAGRGTTQQEQAYDYTDQRPLPGLSHYRLKQVDYDGAFEYHGPVSVRRGIGDGGMKVFPNPVGDRLFPVLPDADPQGQLRLVSGLGQEVGRWPAAAATDGLPVADLPAGVYLLQWLDERGAARAEAKVVR